MADSATFNTREEVDFVVIGSGAAGGIIAKELSTAGHSTVVLEQGKYRKTADFTHDEIKYFLNSEWFGKGPRESGMSFRKAEGRIKILFLKFDRLGLAYRFSTSGDFKGISFVFRSTFDS